MKNLGTAFWSRIGIDLILVSSNPQVPSTLLNEVCYGKIKMPKDWQERGSHKMEPMSNWVPLYKHLDTPTVWLCPAYDLTEEKAFNFLVEEEDEEIINSKCVSKGARQQSRDAFLGKIFSNLIHVVVINPQSRDIINEYVLPWTSHPLTRLYWSQVGYNTLTRGGPNYADKPSDYDEFLENTLTILSKEFDTCSHLAQQSLLFESHSLNPDDWVAEKFELKVRNSKFTHVGLSHGPLLQSFEQYAGVDTIAALAICGKSVLDTVTNSPTANHGVAFVSPISFITIFSPTLGRYIESDTSKSVVYRPPPTTHAQSFYNAYFDNHLPYIKEQVDKQVI